jgi:hypothetical protein
MYIVLTHETIAFSFNYKKEKTCFLYFNNTKMAIIANTSH